MEETNYDALKEFATRVQNDLNYDLKLQFSLISQHALLMQFILEEMDTTPNNDYQQLYENAEKIKSYSDSASEIITAFNEYIQTVIHKNDQ